MVGWRVGGGPAVGRQAGGRPVGRRWWAGQCSSSRPTAHRVQLRSSFPVAFPLCLRPVVFDAFSPPTLLAYT